MRNGKSDANGLRGIALGFALALAWAASAAAAPATHTVTFSGHGEFFSRELHLTPALDPEVFVEDGQATAGQGPGGVAHIDGSGPRGLTTSRRPSSTTRRVTRSISASAVGSLPAAPRRSRRAAGERTSIQRSPT